MHTVYRIEVARRLVMLYWIEFPSATQLREVVEAAVANSEFETGMNFLWDRKPGAANPASIQFLREMLYFFQMLAERIGPHSWAIVCHNAADFGRARMLESMSDDTKVTIRAFHSAGDAEEWLRNPIRYDASIAELPVRNPSGPHPIIV